MTAASTEAARATVRQGLDAAKLLPVGHWTAEVTAGLNNPWQGQLGAFVRGEIAAHPLQGLTAFGFVEADTVGVQAGVGLRVAL